MKLNVYKNNILHIVFKSQKEMVLTMFRLQEYYECSSNKIRNKVFTFEQFLDFYVPENGDIDYFRKVSGFNIPGSKLEEFFVRFVLSEREKKLLNRIQKYRDKDYYLLATKDGDLETLDHELIHAQYYLNPNYKKQAIRLIKNIRPELYHQIIDILKSKGYAKEVLADEINAFLATSGIKYLRKSMHLDVNDSDIEPFEKLAATVL